MAENDRVRRIHREQREGRGKTEELREDNGMKNAPKEENSW